LTRSYFFLNADYGVQQFIVQLS